jgi:hypothetical protein
VKLFVWDKVLWDYTPGMAFAVAETVEEARAMPRERSGHWQDFEGGELDVEPRVSELPDCGWCYGGS